MWKECYTHLFHHSADNSAYIDLVLAYKKLPCWYVLTASLTYVNSIEKNVCAANFITWKINNSENIFKMLWISSSNLYMHYNNKKHSEHHTEIVTLQMFVSVTDQKALPKTQRI